MANINTADIEIGNHTACNGSEPPTLTHSRTAQSSLAEAALPRSSDGQEIFGAVADALLGNEVGDGLDAIIDETDGAVHNGYCDQLDWYLDELLCGIVDDIQDVVSRQFLQHLSFSASDLERVSDGNLNEGLTSQAALGLPSVLDLDAFKSLMGKLQDRLPQFVRDALRWHVDTSELTNFLSKEIEGFITLQVLPQVARNICEAEVVVSEHAQLESRVNLVGGAYHG